MFVSYHLISVLCVWGSTKFCFRMSAKIVWVSVTGMLVYKLVMSNEAMLKCGIMGVSFSFCIRVLEFSMLKALARGG